MRQEIKPLEYKDSNMNKSELISAVAATARLTKADATRAVDAVITTITNELATGGNVALIGFGRFEARLRTERQGRNPATGEEITIPAAYVPRFKAGSQLKELVAEVPVPAEN